MALNHFFFHSSQCKNIYKVKFIHLHINVHYKYLIFSEKNFMYYIYFFTLLGWDFEKSEFEYNSSQNLRI